MPVAPGGKIIGGMGGRLWFGPLGLTQANFANNSGRVNPFNAASAPISSAGFSVGNAPYSLDVSHWQVQREFILSDCPHTGAWGAINRRLVAFDWQFAAAMPVDQQDMPDVELGYYTAAQVGGWVNISIAFYLGDVVLNPEAAAMNMTQKYYYAPAAYLQRAVPVLDAARDVIRINVTGAGNSRLFLLPDEATICGNYVAYLQSRKWWQ